MDYPIHGSGGSGHVFEILLPKGGSEGPILVRFLVIKQIIIIIIVCTYIMLVSFIKKKLILC